MRKYAAIICILAFQSLHCDRTPIDDGREDGIRRFALVPASSSASLFSASSK